ncbi:hypothetical protein IZ6_16170 [Terrihabitans soli]|uniref:Uncharacterized protein n=1 Tax=Terrihabitans soli TaxID=708113 RepID=A0A6S6QUE2_9HYPH|nr:hypothetical protein IZ6_16170 [Terrihabitans soli]
MFVAFAAAVSPVLAQAPENAPGVTWEAAPLPDVKPVQISLTTDMVERFVASLPTLLAMTRDLDREQGRVDPTAAEEDLSFVLVPYLFDPKIEAHINEKLAEFGFASYAEWANVAHSVSLVEEASDFTGAIDLAGQEQAARAEIEANKALSDEERSKAIDELKSQFAALAEFEPLPGNRETAAPFLERLRAARGR